MKISTKFIGEMIRPQFISMFVVQVVGKSMQPAISNGAWCLVRAPVEGARQGKTAFVQLHDSVDHETRQRCTVKHNESEETDEVDAWRRSPIIPKPLKPDLEPIVVTVEDEGEMQVIAELTEVRRSES